MFPSTSASAAPVGTSAEVLDACGNDARISLTNKSDSQHRFDLWQYGDRSPYATVQLAAGSTTIVARTLEETSQRLTVRINGAPLADRVVSRSELCVDEVVPLLPAVADGVSSQVLPPACNATAIVRVNNGEQDAETFEVTRASTAVPVQVIKVTKRAVISTTIDVANLGVADSAEVADGADAVDAAGVADVVQVRANGHVVADSTVVPSGKTCVSTPKIDSLRAPFGAWGAPVRVEDFSGDGVQKGVGGWQIYDKPKGLTPRSKDTVHVGASESGTGELQIAGRYDKAGNVHIGGGLADTFGQQYGRWEVRARTDKGAGFAPTILLWPHGGHWPEDGEIDLLEGPKGNRLSAIAVLHNGPANHFRTHGLDGDQSEWHTYAVEWLPTRVTFYLDGVEQWMVTDQSLIPKTSQMHLALQLDAGCGWVQCPNAQTAPETVMHVDWVKVYAAPPSMLPQP